MPSRRGLRLGGGADEYHSGHRPRVEDEPPRPCRELLVGDVGDGPLADSDQADGADDRHAAGAAAPLRTGRRCRAARATPSSRQALAGFVSGEHVQSAAGRRVDQAALSGDALVGVLVDDRQDQAAPLVAGEHGAAGPADVILRDRVTTDR